MDNISVTECVFDLIADVKNHKSAFIVEGLANPIIGETFKFESDKGTSTTKKITGVKYTKGEYLTSVDAYVNGYDSLKDFVKTLKGDWRTNDFSILYYENAEPEVADEEVVKAPFEKKPLGYLAGNIMGFGDGLAREYEYKEFLRRNIPVEVYSPIQNKSINDKSHMTEEENNHLAEKITSADIERLWNSDFVVMCPEQNAIGSLCETGCIYGWKYMTDKFIEILNDETLSEYKKYEKLVSEIHRINDKKDYFHYFDIRTNHLNEKDWRRSFSINQLLYGMILYASKYPEGIQTFDSIMDDLEKEYKPQIFNIMKDIDLTESGDNEMEGEVANDR